MNSKNRHLCKKFQGLTIDELYDIMQLRQEVFVVEQDCAYLDADGLDKKAHHYMIYTDQELIAYTRIFPKGMIYEKYHAIGRVVTSKSCRGLGIGKVLMIKSIAKCLELYGNQPIKISAQLYLRKFYEDLRFEVIGKGYLEDGIPHIAMIYNLPSP